MESVAPDPGAAVSSGQARRAIVPEGGRVCALIGDRQRHRAEFRRGQDGKGYSCNGCLVAVITGVVGGVAALFRLVVVMAVAMMLGGIASKDVVDASCCAMDMELRAQRRHSHQRNHQNAGQKRSYLRH